MGLQRRGYRRWEQQDPVVGCRRDASGCFGPDGRHRTLTISLQLRCSDFEEQPQDVLPLRRTAAYRCS